MPILAGEADETERAVNALPIAVRKAVEIWYLRAGSINQKRKMLGCRRERMLELLDEARAQILVFLSARAQNKAAP